MKMDKWDIEMMLVDVAMALVAVLLLPIYPFVLLYHRYKDC